MLPAVAAGDPRAVHRTRVASRRLREIIPVLQLESATSAKLVKKLRKATRQLGRVREMDVLLALLEELRRSGRYPERVLRRVADDVKKERPLPKRKKTSKAIASELQAVQRKLQRVSDDLEARPGRHAKGWRWAIDARVARRATALRTAIQKAGAMYLPERLHAVRIALKKLRYALELSVEAGGGTTNADLRLLKREQVLLGRLHDIQVLIDRVRHAQASIATPDLIAWRELAALGTSLENGARRLHARYLRNRHEVADLCTRRIAELPEAPGAAAHRTPARRAG
jgi:CHAD domain-containing protein